MDCFTKQDISDISLEDWLRLRKTGIGGSDASIIMGINPWSTPMKLYNEKISDTVNTYQTESMYFGHILEEVVAQEFAKRTGLEVEVYPYFLRSREHPFITANIDRKIKAPGFVGLECKTTSAGQDFEWTDKSVPPYYYVQVQHYMYVTGAKEWYMAVLIGGNKFREYHIARDDELIEKMVELETKFWNEHVLPRKPPYNWITQNKDNMHKLLDEYVKLHKQISVYQRKLNNIERQLQKYMDSNQQLVLSNGKYKATLENGKICVSPVGEDEFINEL